MKNKFFIFVLFFYISFVHSYGVFNIESIAYYKESTPSGVTIQKKKTNTDGISFYELQPFLAVKVSSALQVRYDTTISKVYFYNKEKKLIVEKSPSIASRLQKGSYDVPAFFEKDKPEMLFFEIPETVRSIKDWVAVVIFGNNDEVVATTYPNVDITKYDFTEKNIIRQRNNNRMTEDSNPLIEHRVSSSTQEQPRISLFLLLPENKKAKGLLAVCLLANSLESIKKNLLNPSKGGEMYEIKEFARKHNLAILSWGAKSMWNRNKNWTEQTASEYKNYDKKFDSVSAAWIRGVNSLCEKNNIPLNNFLLWGSSGAAQYAMRLALRHPDKFLAVAVHIPSSFDKPTPEGNKILWCLTTGELESGYGRSLSFYSECCGPEYNYLMLYKAIIGLGHKSSSISTKIRIAFFEYALKMLQHHEKNTWGNIFRETYYYGDVINQRIIFKSQLSNNPNMLLTPIPDNIVELWKSDFPRY